MNPNRLGVAFSSYLVASTLSSCELKPLPRGYVSIYLENWVENSDKGKEAEPCAGGLKAQLIQEQKIVYESVIVPPGSASSENRYSEFNDGFGVETLRLTVRAFCYGQRGEEVGYAETTNTFGKGGGTGLAFVTLEGRFEPDSCFAGEARGRAPCIILD